MKLQELERLQKDYIEGLIKFSRSQKKYWRKIPYLAARCQGNGGYSDQYEYVTRSGFWRVGGGNGYGSYSYRVDCETGNICDWTLKGDDLKPAKASTRMMIIDVDDLNAEKICEELIRRAQREFSSIFKTREQVKAEQDELIKKYKIEEIYKRQK